VDNIKLDLREIGWDGMDWIELAHVRGHGNEYSGSIKCYKVLEYCTIGGFSIRAQLHE
jgi:hypothetical protein